MERLIRGIDVLILSLVVGMCGCSKLKPSTDNSHIPQRFLTEQDNRLKRIGEKLMYEDRAFSGFIETWYEDGEKKSLTPYFEGLRAGIVYTWHRNGVRRSERRFKKGKKEGEHRGWWENGQLKYQYFFEDGEHEGSFTEWYANGDIYRLANFKAGQEQGKQQRWDEQGKYLSNYVVREGRMYGIIGTKPCITIAEEN